MRALGRFDEARAHYERALALDPELSDAHAGLAVIGRLPNDEAQVSRLRTLAASPETEIEQRVWLSFALGTMLDNAGRYDEAFSSFAQGNTLLRERLAAWGEVYDHDALRRRVTDLMSRLPPSFIRPSNRMEIRRRRLFSSSACPAQARDSSSRSPQVIHGFRPQESSGISAASARPCSSMERGVLWKRWTQVWLADWRTITSPSFSG